MKNLFLFILTTCFMTNSYFTSAQNKQLKLLGEWKSDQFDMPYFEYTGKLPYEVNLQNGKAAKILNDPYFLLGNYRFKMFAHVSGEYELYSTERVISHFNKKEDVQATLKVNNQEFKLTGINSIAANPKTTTRIFGAGFAEYTYRLPQLSCKRIFSVLPSEKINEGTSAFRLTVSFTNTSEKEVKIDFTESLKAEYDKISNSPEHDNLDYSLKFKSINQYLIKGVSSIISGYDIFPLINDRDDVSNNEFFPPTLFISSEFENTDVFKIENNKISANYKKKLAPGEQATINFIIGYSLEDSDIEISAIRNTLMNYQVNTDMNKKINESKYAEAWSNKVVHFQKEKNNNLRRELIWHNYVLEVLATYSKFFDETFIPQGCMYFFSWGLNAAPRDECQHALAACYTNPELAKSAMRYILKKSNTQGYIPFNHTGHGVVTSKFYQTSDQQLFFFLVLSEYLRITNDYDFLLEEVEYYPVKNADSNIILSRIGEYYRYLIEDVGVGPHGLIRLGNSDWNDLVFLRMDTKYNASFFSNESLMNTTMAASILPALSGQLKTAAKLQNFNVHKKYIQKLTAGIDRFREKVWDSFLADHKERTFAKRMYFNNKAIGVDNMFLEPQGFLMQVPEYELERKKELYSEIKIRILDSEKTGARQEEKMELSEVNWGSRENGGIWYSLNGPLIIGLSSWNKDAAWDLFHRLTLQNQIKQYPQYWSCYWSSFDAVDSSILPSEGIHSQFLNWLPDDTKYTYCAHIHAWLIYSYMYLKEKELKDD